jgi:ATP synthase I subunit
VAGMIQAPELVRAEARMPRWMYAIALGGALCTLLLGSGRAAVGFSVGALSGILNYFWIHQAVVALMNAESARVPRSIVIKMVVRYPLCFAGMFLFYKTGWSPILAIIAGLLVPGVGVLTESLFLIGASFRHDELA